MTCPIAYVRELNEGVRRMFEEMERYGLRPPVYTVTEASVRVVLYKEPEEPATEDQVPIPQSSILLFRLRIRLGTERLRLLLTTLQSQGEMPSRDVAELLNVTSPTARGYLRILEEMGLLEQRRKSRRDPNTVWVVTESPLWSEVSSLWQAT
jgi:ATP-dependent DNA helicase RecG